MLPGSTLPTSLQMAVTDSRKSACENEEEYGQKYGHAARLFVRPLAWVIYAILIVAYVLS